ncbi:endolytic transglycosylase MltG [Candidatus Oleimmundimicrobium sp.]|uniref:endolytic transglycosylase MltG n=1 Tax=Candidatus Oleimmundimicrobium sp. TaxID=3060597 RepID=UPI002715DE35|nr:endolytic transglycosylase MltG [Candidatus Oleimmundimicrobium sp.]MDO8886743.1 endolytic transglycosylase MltG [Candidatus Oleimmundimicrobium sp.]
MISRIDERYLKRKNKGRKRFFLIVILLAALLVGFGGYVSLKNFHPFLSSSASLSEQPVLVEIPAGSGINEIGKILVQKKVVSSAFYFDLYAKFSGLGSRFKSGKYNLREGMSYSEVIGILNKGPNTPKKFYKVSIPEGFTLEQIAERLGKNTTIDSEEFKELALNGEGLEVANYDFLKEVPVKSLEGYLFPKTYSFSEDATAKDVLKIMLSQFNQEISKFDFSPADEKGLSTHEIITIASLIEKEVKIPEERELVSAVIYNRLEKNIALQICATVQYILPQRKTSLFEEDLKIDSPYNTYLHTGLPPGPICSPGSTSIEAALNPALVDYLYYVLTGSDGHHTFTSSYDEFLKAKKEAKNGSE